MLLIIVAFSLCASVGALTQQPAQQAMELHWHSHHNNSKSKKAANALLLISVQAAEEWESHSVVITLLKGASQPTSPHCTASIVQLKSTFMLWSYRVEICRCSSDSKCKQMHGPYCQFGISTATCTWCIGLQSGYLKKFSMSLHQDPFAVLQAWRKRTVHSLRVVLEKATIGYFVANLSTVHAGDCMVPATGFVSAYTEQTSVVLIGRLGAKRMLL